MPPPDLQGKTVVHFLDDWYGRPKLTVVFPSLGLRCYKKTGWASYEEQANKQCPSMDSAPVPPWVFALTSLDDGLKL